MDKTIEQMQERHREEIEVLQANCKHEIRTIDECVKCGWHDDIIEDGFGMTCSAYCPECGKKSMQIVRPGKVQCCYCG